MVSLRGSKYGSRVAMACTNHAQQTHPGPPTGIPTRFHGNNGHRGLPVGRGNGPLANRGPPMQVANRGPPMQMANRGPLMQMANRGLPMQMANRGPPMHMVNRGPPAQIANRGPPVQIVNNSSSGCGPTRPLGMGHFR
jgi:hypothetical protein